MVDMYEASHQYLILELRNRCEILISGNVIGLALQHSLLNFSIRRHRDRQRHTYLSPGTSLPGREHHDEGSSVHIAGHRDFSIGQQQIGFFASGEGAAARYLHGTPHSDRCLQGALWNIQPGGFAEQQGAISLASRRTFLWHVCLRSISPRLWC
mgnify:CR=1 FL=1